jgi:hypothetical protein
MQFKTMVWSPKPASASVSARNPHISTLASFWSHQFTLMTCHRRH